MNTGWEAKKIKTDSKFKVFAICIVLFSSFITSNVPQAQLILKEYFPPPTLEFANLDSQIRIELYKALNNVFDTERVRAKREGRYEDVLFNYLYVLLKQLDPKQKDKNLQETDIVRKNALSEDQELFIDFAGGIAGVGVQFLTGIPAHFLGEGAKLLGFKLGEYLVLRDISSATVEYAKIGRIEIVYVHSTNRVFINARLEEPVCKEIFILLPIELKPMKTSWGTYVCPPTWAGLTCPPEAALKEIVPKLDGVKMTKSPRKDRVCATQSAVQPSITSSLQITPKKEKYQVGDVLSAEFNIANNCNASIRFDVLTVGGRVNDICPKDKCPDFEWKGGVTLKPNETYRYNGKLKLDTAGDYHFFTAYRTKDGQWNTVIPTAPGINNTMDIKVEIGAIKLSTNEKILFSHREFRASDKASVYISTVNPNDPPKNPYELSKIVKFLSEEELCKKPNQWFNLFHATISPDGSKIAVPSSGGISIISIEALIERAIRLDKIFGIEDLCWSPNGKKIAFRGSTNDSSNNIYAINIDGTGLIRLTNDKDNFYPIWLPDSKKIMFFMFSKIWSAHLINDDGGDRARVDTNISHAGFSVDSSTMAFDCDGALCVGTLIGTKIINVKRVVGGIYPAKIRWSPDGTKIVFSSFDRNNQGIYIIYKDGSNLRRIFWGTAFLIGWTSNLPTFSPKKRIP